jgi:hypothetical protein
MSRLCDSLHTATVAHDNVFASVCRSKMGPMMKGRDSIKVIANMVEQVRTVILQYSYITFNTCTLCIV